MYKNTEKDGQGMYAELLQPDQGGSVRVLERLVCREGASVPWNVLEPSEEVLMPSGRDVHSAHRLAYTQKARQQGHVLKSRCQLGDGEVERVRLGPPPVQKRAKQGVVVLEACYAIRMRNLGPQLVPLD